MIYRIKQLAAETGIKEDTLRKAVKRSTLIAPSGRLDIFNEKNRQYIEKRDAEFYKDKIELDLSAEPAPPVRPIREISAEIIANARAMAAEPAALEIEPRGKETPQAKRVLQEQELKEEKLRMDIRVKVQDEKLKKQRAELNKVQRQKLRGELLPVDWVVRVSAESISMYKKMMRQTSRTVMRQIMDEYQVPAARRAEFENTLDGEFERTAERYDAKLTEVVQSFTVEDDPENANESTD